ncbi:DUF3159 domain-containing protein [Mycolicibacterium sp. S2-37]|uniref:DUF3159 domain-containing protein n=1 Tax=Mycolicibacterium sp. S2-37 TaxID=2810297 RepID=UPI001A94BC85|nr:DUF3159 domain-containing protein [Mycolicibacterium sp. S2-37]MBO0678714.1 DUF3159 domain-containing protein [Mycolicibacterium sp. S2-37]
MKAVDAQRKPSLLRQVGGVSGLIYASVPSTVFVVADAVVGLDTAVAVAVGAGAGITGLRLLRREPLQPALSGLLGVAIAAFIAFQTGDAKDFFLVGIWMSFAFAAVFLVSILVRRPLVGVLWAALSAAGPSWRADRRSRTGFDAATLVVAVVFAARFVVQNWLYGEDATGWLAFARIAMGYPLTGLALVVVVWAVRRANRRRQVAPARPCASRRCEADAGG